MVPTADSPRIVALDVLRGVGVLGMLAVHIQLFAYPSLARWNPTAWGDLSGLNFTAWLATMVLADGKFIAIFAMLLGVSIVLQREGATAAWRVHLRRMAALLVLGLTHAYGLWYGDMLVPLALCGTVVFLARRLSPASQLALGIVGLGVASALSFALVWRTMALDPALLQAWKEQWTPAPSTLGPEILAYRGGWFEQMEHRVPTAWQTETWDFVTRLFWQMSGLMLIGMALFKLGVLTASRSRSLYVRMAVAGASAGVVLIGLALRRSVATRWDLVEFALVGQQLLYWGNLAMAVAWIAAVMLLCQRGGPLRPLAAVGRMALSNYLAQSVICTTIFYGHGLGLFGEIGRAGQLAIVLGIWTFQIVASMLWLRSFSVGPVEWLTRWVVFGRRPAFVRPAAAAR